MKSDLIEQNSNYLDSLVQMGVLKVVRMNGEEWVVFQRPLAELVDEADRRGLLQADDDINPLSAISCAIGLSALEERGCVFSQEDLHGVAAVIMGAISCILEEGRSGMGLRPESIAPVSRKRSA